MRGLFEFFLDIKRGGVGLGALLLLFVSCSTKEYFRTMERVTNTESPPSSILFKGGVSYRLADSLPVVKEGWRGCLSVRGRFCNDLKCSTPSFWKALKWRFSSNPQALEKRREAFSLPHEELRSLSREDGVTWLGHSTFIIDLGGKRFLTDPVFYDLPFLKRRSPLPLSLDKLRGVDYVLISHDHRDHLDLKSLALVKKLNPHASFLVPLGVGALVGSDKKGRGSVQEAGWYQEYLLSDSVRVFFLPARHWGRRGLMDTNKRLWGGFLLQSQNHKILFAGDTAYDEEMYREVANLFGPLEVCLLPIGAYAPEWMMSTSHTTPEEAVALFDLLGGSSFVPMHYGTFDLSDEPMGEPIRRLRKALSQREPSPLRELVLGRKWLL